MRLLAAISLCVLLIGCAKQPTILQDEVFFHSKIVDDLPRGVFGRATCLSNNLCTIEIRRETYPNCIGHEIVHGHSGDWHKGYETTWGCSTW